MSFYLGKDPNNKAVLHISKGYRTSDQLRGGILGDTIFHSDLPYVQYTAYKATISPINTDFTNANYGLSLPESVLTAMDSQVFCIVVEHSGKFDLYETYLPEMPYIVHYTVDWFEIPSYARYMWTNNTFSEVSAARDSVHRLPAIRLPNPSEVTNVWVVVLDTGITHNTNTSETVYIGKGRLDVDGTSLATYRYITSVPVNNTDPIVYTPNGDPIQFINFTTGTETSLSITSDSGRSIIRSGDKKIFDSGLVRGKVIFDKVTKITYPKAVIKDNGTHDSVIATGMQNGDLYSFYTAVPSHDSSVSSISLGVFRPNTSIAVYDEPVFDYAHNVYLYRDYHSIVCTSDGRLLYRITLQTDSGSTTLSLREAVRYVTHYK